MLRGRLVEVSDDVWRTSWNLKVFRYINQIPSHDAARITANGPLRTLTRALGGTSLNDGIRVLGINPGDKGNEPSEKIL
ncbi:MAG: hypothetical protein ACI9XK_004225 [Granulosicoccus sp.]|jgi:hypothetical protein